MGGQLATGSSIYMASAGVPAADGAGLSSIKSFSQLLTSIAAMPLAGGTFTGNVLFTDNTYDIGASGATRPRTVYAGTSVITPLLNNTNAAALTLGNSTYGVTVPGAAVVSGDISMSKTSAQGYLNLYSPDGTKLLYLFANNGGYGSMVATTNIQMSSASGSMSVTSNQIALSPTSGNAYVFVGGTNSTFDVYDSSGVKYSRLTHDGTNGILSTSSGNLNLVPTGGTVAVTGAVTATTTMKCGTYTVATLPSAGSNAYCEACVSDSNAAASGNYGATVAGGGANKVRVFSDGTNWVIA